MLVGLLCDRVAKTRTLACTSFAAAVDDRGLL